MIIKIKNITILVLILLVSLISYSLIFPKKIQVLDTMRLKIQAPLMKTVGEYQIGEKYYANGKLVEGPEDIPLKDIQKYIGRIPSGSLFFTNSRSYISSEIIPGQWKHAAIYIGTQKQVLARFGAASRVYHCLQPHYHTGEEILIFDSRADGVKIRELKELSNLDKVSYLKAFICFEINTDIHTTELFLLNAFKHIGKNYDYDILTYDDSAFYCSELVFKSLATIGINVNVTSSRFGREAVSPSDIVKYIENTGISNNEFSFIYCLYRKEGKLEVINTDQLSVMK